MCLRATCTAQSCMIFSTRQVQCSNAYAAVQQHHDEAPGNTHLTFCMLAGQTCLGADRMYVIFGHFRSERPALLQRMAAQQALPQLHIYRLPTARLLVLHCRLDQEPSFLQLMWLCKQAQQEPCKQQRTNNREHNGFHVRCSRGCCWYLNRGISEITASSLALGLLCF